MNYGCGPAIGHTLGIIHPSATAFFDNFIEPCFHSQLLFHWPSSELDELERQLYIFCTCYEGRSSLTFLGLAICSRLAYGVQHVNTSPPITLFTFQSNTVHFCAYKSFKTLKTRANTLLSRILHYPSSFLVTTSRLASPCSSPQAPA